MLSLFYELIGYFCVLVNVSVCNFCYFLMNCLFTLESTYSRYWGLLPDICISNIFYTMCLSILAFNIKITSVYNYVMSTFEVNVAKH